MTGEEVQPKRKLSRAERVEIIKELLNQGYTYQEIGDAIGRSKQAVEQQARRDLRKVTVWHKNRP